MVRAFMSKRSAAEKQEVLARIRAFPYCGFTDKITGNIAFHYKSFVGRDFKAFAQMSVFIVSPYTSDDEKHCWLLLSKVQICMISCRHMRLSLGVSSSLLLAPCD